jgi:hypothetical protein
MDGCFHIKGELNFFLRHFMSMKKRDNNPIGNLFLKDLKETAKGPYRHLMKGDSKNDDLVAEKITQDINQHFSGGYNIIWNDTLNHFLVDFDIICILKNTLVMILGLMYQWNKENSATKAITKRIHFLTRMLNKRDTEDLFYQEKH